MKIEIESLIELVAEVLETEPDSLSPGTVLEEIEGWDSVNALRLLTHTESVYQVRLSMKRFHEGRTIQSLAEAIAHEGNHV